MNRKNFFIMFLVAIFMLSGCGSHSSNENTDLVVILGNRNNMPKPKLSFVKEDIKKSLENGNRISFVVSDGNPFLENIEYEFIDRGYDDKKREELINAQCDNIINNVDQLRSKTEEADILKSLELASRELNSYDDANKKIIIIDSMLQTTGDLNFTINSLENISIDDVVTNLKKEKNIPDLSGISIDIYTCGDTYVPQRALTNKNKETLKELWNKILKEGNAKKVEFKKKSPNSEGFTEKDNLPSVTTVDTFIVFDNTKIAFIKQSSQLENEGDARIAISSAIDFFKDKNTDVLVVGTTAKVGDAESSIDLSKERAKTVKKLLIEGGIDESRIKTVGTGFQSKFYKNDQDENGDLIDELAKKNRSVILLDIRSETAKEILKEFPCD